MNMNDDVEAPRSLLTNFTKLIKYWNSPYDYHDDSPTDRGMMRVC